MAFLLDLFPANVGTKLILPASGLLLVSAVCVLAGYSLNGDLYNLLQRPAHVSQLLAFLLLLTPLYLVRYLLLELQVASQAKAPVDRVLLQGAVWTLIILPAALAGMSAIFTVVAYQPAAFSFLAAELRSITPIHFPATDSLLARLPDVSAHARHALVQSLGRVALGVAPAYTLYICLASRVARKEAAPLRWRVLLPALFATALPFSFGWSVVADVVPLWTTAGLLVVVGILASLVASAARIALISVTTVLLIVVALPFLRLSPGPRFADALEISLTSFVVACGMLVPELWLLTKRGDIGPIAANIATALLPCGLLIALFPRVTPDVFIFAPVVIISLALIWHVWLRRAASGKTTTVACIVSGILVPVAVGYFTGSGVVDPLLSFLQRARAAFPLTAGLSFIAVMAFIHYTDRSEPAVLRALVGGPHDRFGHSADSLLLASHCSALVTVLAGILIALGYAVIVPRVEEDNILEYTILRAGVMGVFAIVLSVVFLVMARMANGGASATECRRTPGHSSGEAKRDDDAQL